MQRRTNLPLLLSTLFLLGAPLATGCGDSDGGNTGGSGGNTGGGGGNTGGGGSDTGGSGTTGVTTDTSGLPVCGAQAALVKACIWATGFPAADAEGAFDHDVSGVVTAVRAPIEDEACVVTMHSVGSEPPDVVIDLTLTDGAALTVGIEAPGFSDTTISVGDTLGVKYHWAKIPAGFAYGFEKAIEITRDGQLVAAIGSNAPAGVQLSGGDEVCRTEGGICKLHYMEMDITAKDGTTVSIPPDESAEVDGLLVTNDAFYKYYSDGNCNFSFSVEYVMSAVAQ